MIAITTLKEWLVTLDPKGSVAIDDGGLTLVELDENNKKTGAYYEVGGIPLVDEDDQLWCRECGMPMFIDPTGISHHTHTEYSTDIAHEIDADHVAVADV